MYGVKVMENVVVDYLIAYVQDHGGDLNVSHNIERRKFITYITELLDMQADQYGINRELSAEDYDYIQELTNMFIQACQHKDDYMLIFDEHAGCYVLDEEE